MIAWSEQGEGDGKFGERIHLREEVKEIGLGMDSIWGSDAG